MKKKCRLEEESVTAVDCERHGRHGLEPKKAIAGVESPAWPAAGGRYQTQAPRKSRKILGTLLCLQEI